MPKSPSPRRRRPVAEPMLAPSDRFFELSLDLFCVAGSDGTLRRVNPAWEWTLGWGAEELVGHPLFEFIHADDREDFAAVFRRAAAGAGLAAHVARARTRPGPMRWVEWSATPPDGPERLIYVVARDITSQREAEVRMRHDADLWQTLLRTIPDTVFFKDLDGRFTQINQAQAAVLGVASPADAVGRTDADFFSPEHAAAARADEQRVIATGRPLLAKIERAVMRDGTVRWFTVTKAPLRDADDRITGTFGTAREISDLMRAEEALRASESRYREVFDNNPNPMWLYDVDSLAIVEVNRAAQALYGWTREEFLRLTLRDLRSPEDGPRLAESLPRADAPPQMGMAARHRTRDGRALDVEITSYPIAAGGRPVRLVQVNDVTERRRAERALAASESRYRLLFERNLAGVYRSTIDGRLLECNEAFARIYGYDSPAEARAQASSAYHLDPPGRDAFIARLRETGSFVNLEWPHRRKDGAAIWVLENAAFVPGDEEGTVCIEGTVVDITDRRRLEEQLRQSQKMEAVGQLAGGVAHDFNNLLTAILGFCALLLDATPPPDPRRRDVEEIRGAASRAASLTQQLLAFSRRQVLQPVVLDLGAVIASMETMLRRLISEHIQLATHVPGDLWPVLADQGQVEQVIVNLAVNARDAMPEGGRLTIAAVNAQVDADTAAAQPDAAPGAYVVLEVSDTGAGMPPDVQARIFEPFFTTKGPGGGTGLGLATVYGVVKQSGGFIAVRSEPGRGTRFRVHLPRAAGARRVTPPPEKGPPRRGTETVLVVEDEPVVRTLTRSALRRYGYEVLEAGGGADALAVARGFGGAIALLLTDVVMPGMNGRELAETLARERPGLRVLYSSGYTDDAIVRHGAFDPGVAFLQKPYTPDDLLRAVRAVLDGGTLR